MHTGRFGYTGQIRLPEGGLYSYKARVYSPQLGRFLEPDPIGTADNQNLYAYVGNDPVNWVDPFGLQSLQPFPTAPLDLSVLGQVNMQAVGPDIILVTAARLPSVWWSDVVGVSTLNFTAGFTSTLTFGVSDYAFEYAGVQIDTNSTAYTAVPAHPERSSTIYFS